MKKYFGNKELLNSRNIRFGVDNTLITNRTAAFAVTQMLDWVKKASERTDVTIVSDFQILSKEVRSTSYYMANMASSSSFPAAGIAGFPSSLKRQWIRTACFLLH